MTLSSDAKDFLKQLRALVVMLAITLAVMFTIEHYAKQSFHRAHPAAVKIQKVRGLEIYREDDRYLIRKEMSSEAIYLEQK